MKATLKIAGSAAVLAAALATTGSAAGNTPASWLDNTISPVANPIYFEDPKVTSEVHPVYMYHFLPDTFYYKGGSLALGGQVQVTAVQLRYALTDRLGLIATKDGYIEFQPSKNLPHEYGWADLAAGLKYELVDDEDNQFLLTPGFTLTIPTGCRNVFQNHGSGEWNLFVSAEKGWDKFHLTGNAGFRLPDNFAEETAQLKDDLQQLMVEFEDIVQAARGAIGAETDDLVDQVRECLDTARDRLESLEQRISRELRAGARAVDGYLRENAWAVLGLVAASAFLLGVVVTRRR